MLECVYERVARARLVDRVIVATDDPRISEAACGFGAAVAMTRADHSTGTERVAEVAAGEKADIIVNVQGDEPLIDPAAIDQAIRPLVDGGESPAATLRPPMATLKKRITDPRELHDPNVVKVVTDFRGNAIYFSRSLIPFPRGAAAGTAAGAAGPVGTTTGAAAAGGVAGKTAGTSAAGAANGSAWAASGIGPAEGPGVLHYKHIGLYVYQREFLLGYPKLRVGPLEQAEKLEQLRALENGYPIRVVETDYEAIGVDTPEDLERVRAMLEGAGPQEGQARGGARHG